LWRNSLIDAAIFREWMTSIGRRSAKSSIAHLLCELVVKFRAVGLAEDHMIQFPITQGELGDALGLSNVHVNRSMTALKRDGLIR
jgi:CRP-like cAMP-binding protein